MFLEEIRRSKKMIIRKAEEKDIPRIIELLGQVLQIHAVSTVIKSFSETFSLSAMVLA